jgi:S-DNA-T family DNA segregation ATPase FtsK/SpoIIIE
MSNPNAVTVGDVEVEMDPLLPQALKLFIESGQGSTSMLQRKFAIGFSRAGRIVDQMEELKYISPSDGAKARNVYITMEKYKQIFEED